MFKLAKLFLIFNIFTMCCHINSILCNSICIKLFYSWTKYSKLPLTSQLYLFIYIVHALRYIGYGYTFIGYGLRYIGNVFYYYYVLLFSYLNLVTCYWFIYFLLLTI